MKKKFTFSSQEIWDFQKNASNRGDIKEFSGEKVTSLLQWRPVITLSSGSIFWDRFISEASYGVDLFYIVIPRQTQGTGTRRPRPTLGQGLKLN